MQEFCHILPFKRNFYEQITRQWVLNWVLLTFNIHNIFLIWICVLNFQIDFNFRGLKDGHSPKGGRLFKRGASTFTYVFLATESEYDIHFSLSHLHFAVLRVASFTCIKCHISVYILSICILIYHKISNMSPGLL